MFDEYLTEASLQLRGKDLENHCTEFMTKYLLRCLAVRNEVFKMQANSGINYMAYISNENQDIRGIAIQFYQKHIDPTNKLKMNITAGIGMGQFFSMDTRRDNFICKHIGVSSSRSFSGEDIIRYSQEHKDTLEIWPGPIRNVSDIPIYKDKYQAWLSQYTRYICLKGGHDASYILEPLRALCDSYFAPKNAYKTGKNMSVWGEERESNVKHLLQDKKGPRGGSYEFIAYAPTYETNLIRQMEDFLFHDKLHDTLFVIIAVDEEYQTCQNKIAVRFTGNVDALPQYWAEIYGICKGSITDAAMDEWETTVKETIASLVSAKTLEKVL